jgi:hypothetical protein
MHKVLGSILSIGKGREREREKERENGGGRTMSLRLSSLINGMGSMEAILQGYWEMKCAET